MQTKKYDIKGLTLEFKIKDAADSESKTDEKLFYLSEYISETIDGRRPSLAKVVKNKFYSDVGYSSLKAEVYGIIDNFLVEIYEVVKGTGVDLPVLSDKGVCLDAFLDVSPRKIRDSLEELGDLAFSYGGIVSDIDASLSKISYKGVEVDIDRIRNKNGKETSDYLQEVVPKIYNKIKEDYDFMPNLTVNTNLSL